MSMHNQEMRMLQEIAGAFLRHPEQINQLSEADAEIVPFPKEEADYLVLKIDGISEEIQQKLYEAPAQIGWMAITVTISDLAAVGAEPLGVLQALQIPEVFLENQAWMAEFRRGVNAACGTYGVPILGGDTNTAPLLAVTTAGVATGKKGKTLLRKGISNGDALYATGALGLGNAYAYAHYFDAQWKVDYQPLARLQESRVIRDFASACMDTSDGLFPALSVLAELNDLGFILHTPLEKLLHPEAMQIGRATQIPPWIWLAGPHGEYELIFSIPTERIHAFETTCAHNHLPVFYLGVAQSVPKIDFISEQLKVSCEPARIANLFLEAKGDVQLYFKLLLQQHRQWMNL